MASASTSEPQAVPPIQKKARLNPGRRKALRAKTSENVASTAKKLHDTTLARTQPASEVRREASTVKQTAEPQSNSKCGDDKSHCGKPSSSPGSAQSSTALKERDNNDGETDVRRLATPAVVTGGLIGCAAAAAVLLGAGFWKDIGGTDSAILAVRTAKLCMNNLCEETITSLRAGTYNAPEALDMLRRTTLAYASAVPGGAPIVERVFREVDMIRKQRGKEVDKVVRDTYEELSKAGKNNTGPQQMQAIILRNLAKLSTFATSATQDVLARNPTLRPHKENVAKALNWPPARNVPTVKLNMSVQHLPVRAA